MSSHLNFKNCIVALLPFLVSAELDLFVECSSLSRPINNQRWDCVNTTTIDYFLCSVEMGKKVMVENRFQFYRAICECKALLSVPNYQFACAMGAYDVWMTSQGTENKADSINVLYPCIKSVEFPGACYRAFWFYNHLNMPMRDAQVLCLGINDKIHRHGCVHGVAYGFSSQHFSSTGLLYPLDMLCSSGTAVDRIMCIHGYWGGVNVNSAQLKSMKSSSCSTFRDSLFREPCMLTHDIVDLPHDSPLFQPASSARSVTSRNMTQANALLVNGLNQSLVTGFKNQVLRLQESLPLNVVKNYYPALGINGIIYAVETAGPRCNLSACHIPCHNVGRLVYIKTQNLDAAINLCGRGCKSGCFHGALRQWFQTVSSAAPKLEFQSYLTPYYKWLRASSAYNIFSEDVFHALGHAILESFAGYRYQAGLNQCKYVPEQKLQYKCAMGVWMEYMKDNFTQSGLSPCDASDVDFPAACYYILWHQMRLPSLSTGQHMCLALSNAMDRHGCFHGMGFAYTEGTWRKDRSLHIAEICGQGDLDDQKMCLFGALNWPGPFAADSNLLTSICTAVPASLYSVCMGMGYDKMSKSNIHLFYYTNEMRANGTVLTPTI